MCLLPLSVCYSGSCRLNLCLHSVTKITNSSFFLYSKAACFILYVPSVFFLLCFLMRLIPHSVPTFEHMALFYWWVPVRPTSSSDSPWSLKLIAVFWWIFSLSLSSSGKETPLRLPLFPVKTSTLCLLGNACPKNLLREILDHLSVKVHSLFLFASRIGKAPDLQYLKTGKFCQQLFSSLSLLFVLPKKTSGNIAFLRCYLVLISVWYSIDSIIIRNWHDLNDLISSLIKWE